MSEEDIRKMDKRNLATTRQSSTVVNSKDGSNVRNSPSIPRNYQGSFNKTTENIPSKKFSTIQKDPTKFAPIDKRPKSRGTYSICTKETLKGDETNTRILNFFFEDNHGWVGRRNNQITTQIGKKYSSHGNVFNKEVFLQANCQFIVKPDGDYIMHHYDPDLLADWESIEQIKIFSHEDIICPICLYPPSAGKITRCGHIYCWPCILHYLSLEDKTWRKCPICYESIHVKELRSVKVEIRKEITVGQTMMMKLMCKWRGEVVIAPKSLCSTIKDRAKLCSVNDNLIESYSKLLLSDDEYVNKLIETEAEQLMVLLAQEEENSLESSYIKMALNSLEERIALRKTKCIKNSPTSTEDFNNEIKFTAKPSKIYLSAFDDLVGSIQLKSKNENDGTTKLMHNEQNTLINDSVKKFALEDAENLNLIKNSMAQSELEFIDSNLVCSNDLYKGIERLPNNQIDDKGFDDRCKNLETSLDFDKPVTDFFRSDGTCLDNMKILEYSEINQKAIYPAELLEEKGIKLNEPDCVEDSNNEDLCAIGGKIKPGSAKDAFYFYQASDGQHLYMHPLNICCLKREYGGDLSQCPNEITATVLEIESHFMSQENRRRMRYLNHLPLTCEFQLIELDLKPPIISQGTLTLMSEEIKSRADERKRREKRDKKRAERYQRDENRKMGIDPNSKIVRSDFQSENFQIRNDSLCDDTVDIYFESAGGSSPKELSTTPSFAQMLKLGKAKSSSDSMPSTKSNCEEKSLLDENEERDDGMVPEYRVSFGAAFEKQLDQRLDEFEKLEIKNESKTDKNTQKKKKKKLLLFSTCSRVPGQ